MSSPTITSKAVACRDALQELSKIVSSANSSSSRYLVRGKELQKSVDDAIARFRAWATSIAAFHDSKRRTSLDFRLKDSPEITMRTLRILDDLHEYVTDCKFSQYLDGIVLA
jgi:hypothetical protein